MNAEELKTLFDVSEVVGSPIEIDRSTTIVPVSKVSYGYVGGNGGFFNNKDKDAENNNSVNATGLGMTVTPLGILICGEKNTYIKIDENFGEERWLTLTKSILKSLQKPQ